MKANMKSWAVGLGLLGTAALALAQTAAPEAAATVAEAAAAAVPVPNKGDTGWMMVSTLLVLMMAVPGLALFYGGLVRSKNMLSVLMQVMVTFSLILVLWFIYGYSLAFTEGNAFIGGLDRLFMKGVWDNVAGTFANAATFSKGVYIPEIVFSAFQATFAGITCALIVGAFAERAKFSAVLLFMALWFTFSYIPVAHMVWFWMGPDAYASKEVVDEMTSKAGLIWQWGALDFAGGTVVHINAAVAGLVGAFMIGKRVGYGREAMAPHSLPLTMVGGTAGRVMKILPLAVIFCLLGSLLESIILLPGHLAHYASTDAAGGRTARLAARMKAMYRPILRFCVRRRWLVGVLTFAAFLGAASGPAPNGWSGALLCLLAIFLPSFLLIAGALPFWERLRHERRVRATLAGVNAAVVGLLLAALYQPLWTEGILRPADFALLLFALLALLAWKTPPWQVVLACAVAGGLIATAG